ncbi:hypothetical protein LJC20_00300 [Eubacteriales bacterium OttesenSCG-928-M02]|nr:hypothetical protein [Eubacteriales bacterium OttesenSCG-928-M02]
MKEVTRLEQASRNSEVIITELPENMRHIIVLDDMLRVFIEHRQDELYVACVIARVIKGIQLRDIRYAPHSEPKINSVSVKVVM